MQTQLQGPHLKMTVSKPLSYFLLCIVGGVPTGALTTRILRPQAPGPRPLNPAGRAAQSTVRPTRRVANGN